MSRKVTQRLVELMQADRDRGMSYQKIADKYGLGQTTVHKYLVYEGGGTRNLHVPPNFEEEWNESRGILMGFRPVWAKEWNEARERLMKGARC